MDEDDLRRRLAELERRMDFQESIWKWVQILVYFLFAWIAVPIVLYRFDYYGTAQVWMGLSIFLGIYLEYLTNKTWKGQRKL